MEVELDPNRIIWTQMHEASTNARIYYNMNMLCLFSNAFIYHSLAQPVISNAKLLGLLRYLLVRSVNTVVARLAFALI